MERAEGASVQSIDRAFDILEYLSNDRSGFRLTELSEGLGLHKSTVYRLLSAMQARGYIEKNDKKYKLGLRFIHLSSQLLNSIELKTEAEPLLRMLSDETGQTVFLAVRDGHDVVYIDKVEQFNSLRRYSIIGTRAPVYCTSLGRALLMFNNEAELDRIIDAVELRKISEKTITDKKELIEKIKFYRIRGWSEDVEEFQDGVRCVGAPVFDYRGKVIAAISTAWNIKKTDADPDEIGRLVKKTASEVTLRLGGLSG